MNNPYGWLQEQIALVPEFLQPVFVALIAAIPYVEGEGAASIGIILGIHPLIAATAAVGGNVLCVIAVVYLGSRIRRGVVARRKERVLVGQGAGGPGELGAHTTADEVERGDTVSDARGGTKPDRRTKGRAKLRRWMVRFGVPGASLLAPLALPTMVTAAFFVASGVRKEWVVLWQVVAIVLWTGVIAAAATGLVTVLGW